MNNTTFVIVRLITCCLIEAATGEFTLRIKGVFIDFNGTAPGIAQSEPINAAA